jgi:hypothetical protein
VVVATLSIVRWWVCAGVVALLVLSQTPEPLERDVLAQAGPLDRQGVAEALATVRNAAAGKTFILYGGFGGANVRLGEDGRVRFVQHGDKVTEYTYRQARGCDGELLAGTLVIEWERNRGEWTATSRESRDFEALEPVFRLLSPDPLVVEDAGLAEIEGVPVRGLSYPYEPHPNAEFQARRQIMWFDLRTLLPMRHVVLIEGPREMQYGYYLAHAPGLDIGPRPRTEAPNCVAGR